MNGFSDITVTWQGADYTIRATKMMDLIVAVEHILEMHEHRFSVQVLTEGKGPSIGKLSWCYAEMLRHAGAAVTREEVYLTIHNGIAAGNGPEQVSAVREYVAVLLATISPPLGVALQGGEDAEGKAAAAGS